MARIASLRNRRMYTHVNNSNPLLDPGSPASQVLRDAEELFDDDYVCMVAADHPLRGRRVELATYLAYPHVVIDVVRGLQSPVDQPLAARGLRRRVGYRTPFLASAIFAVARTSMILTVPRRLAASYATTVSVRTLAAPREVAALSYALIWLKRLDASAAHAWLRRRIQAIAETTFSR